MQDGFVAGLPVYTVESFCHENYQKVDDEYKEMSHEEGLAEGKLNNARNLI